MATTKKDKWEVAGGGLDRNVCPHIHKSRASAERCLKELTRPDDLGYTSVYWKNARIRRVK